MAEVLVRSLFSDPDEVVLVVDNARSPRASSTQTFKKLQLDSCSVRSLQMRQSKQLQQVPGSAASPPPSRWASMPEKSFDKPVVHPDQKIRQMMPSCDSILRMPPGRKKIYNMMFESGGGAATSSDTMLTPPSRGSNNMPPKAPVRSTAALIDLVLNDLDTIDDDYEEEDMECELE